MIVNKMMLLTYEIEERVRQEERRLKAIASVRKLLSGIDFSSEVVPCDNTGRLKKTLESLKGKPLSKDEYALLKDIVCK